MQIKLGKLDLHEGDAVYVEKGGEIIPKIVGVNLEERMSSAKKVDFILECPECKTELIREEGGSESLLPERKRLPNSN